jgi:protein-S-isoprenylcysteine O-methyltransferase Ste14
MSLARVSILGFAVAVAALVRLFYIQSLFGTEPISIGIQVAAGLLMVWARVTFGKRSFHAAANPTEGGLVTNGPYAFVRNPIYAAAILFTWTGVAVHLSLESAALALVMGAGMLARIFAEEKMLRPRYGAAYSEYEKRVKRLVPGVF